MQLNKIDIIAHDPFCKGYYLNGPKSRLLLTVCYVQGRRFPVVRGAPNHWKKARNALWNPPPGWSYFISNHWKKSRNDAPANKANSWMVLVFLQQLLRTLMTIQYYLGNLWFFCPTKPRAFFHLSRYHKLRTPVGAEDSDLNHAKLVRTEDCCLVRCKFNFWKYALALMASYFYARCVIVIGIHHLIQ